MGTNEIDEAIKKETAAIVAAGSALLAIIGKILIGKSDAQKRKKELDDNIIECEKQLEKINNQLDKYTGLSRIFHKKDICSLENQRTEITKKLEELKAEYRKL